MGKLQKFEITFSQVPPVYNAGTHIQGTVRMVLSEPMPMRNMRLCVSGLAKVHWVYSSGKHTRHYRAGEVYMDTTVLHFGSLMGDALEHPAGHHLYNFDVEIPTSAPSSFEGEFGHVQYMCKATIERPWKFDHNVEALFTVIRPLDLNAEGPELLLPYKAADTLDISWCCWTRGTVTATFSTNKRGYVGGENIIINAEIYNNSSVTMDYTKVVLKQYIDYHSDNDDAGDLVKSVSEVVAQMSQPEIAPSETYRWENLNFRIPPLPPSRLAGCNAIDIRYVIQFKVGSSHDIRFSYDIVIGSIPLHSDNRRQRAIVMSQPCPSAPPADVTPTFPLMNHTPAPPPTYEECVRSKRYIQDEDDSQCTRGQLDWAPSYPTYNGPPSSSALTAEGATPVNWNVESSAIEENSV